MAKIDGILWSFNKTLLLKRMKFGSSMRQYSATLQCLVPWSDEVAASGPLKDYALRAPGLPEDVEDTNSLFQTSLDIL